MKGGGETALVKACLALLRLRGVFAWRNNSGAFVLGVGAGRRFFRAGLPGSSDIFGVLPPTGRFLSVEVKVGQNRPAAKQQLFAAAVRACGGLAFTVWSVAELIELLDENGA